MEVTSGLIMGSIHVLGYLYEMSLFVGGGVFVLRLSLDFSLSIYLCLKVAMYVVGVCVSVTPIFLHVCPKDEMATQQILILRSYLSPCMTVLLVIIWLVPFIGKV